MITKYNWRNKTSSSLLIYLLGTDFRHGCAFGKLFLGESSSWMIIKNQITEKQQERAELPPVETDWLGSLTCYVHKMDFMLQTYNIASCVSVHQLIVHTPHLRVEYVGSIVKIYYTLIHPSDHQTINKSRTHMVNFISLWRSMSICVGKKRI